MDPNPFDKLMAYALVALMVAGTAAVAVGISVAVAKWIAL